MQNSCGVCGPAMLLSVLICDCAGARQPLAMARVLQVIANLITPLLVPGSLSITDYNAYSVQEPGCVLAVD